MKLRQKAFLVILVTFLCLSIGLYQIAQNTLRQNTWRAEELMARQNVLRVRSAMDQQLAPLVQTNSDWARWNDAYRFVQEENRSFYNDNLTDSTIVTLQSEVIVFGRLNGKLVFATGYDLKHERKIPTPNGLANYLTPEKVIIKKAARGEGVKGCLELPGGILMISSRPVTHGNGSGPIKGFMLIGRWWDSNTQKQLEKVTSLKLTAHSWNETDTSGALRLVKDSLARTGSTQIAPVSPSTILGFMRLNDLSGRPLSILRIETPRPLHEQSLQSLRNLLVSMLVLGSAFSLVTLAILDSLVLHRLQIVTGELDAISKSVDPNARVTVKGRDELGHLAEQVNATLETLCKTHGELEQRVNDRTTQLQETNIALQAEIVDRRMIMSTLRELVDQLEAARDEAQQANEAKNEFLSRMSHELRTPLNAVLGFGQLLELEDLNAEQRESVEHILRAGRHLLDLINEVLDITRIETGSLALTANRIDVNEVIVEVCGMIQSLADKQKVSIVFKGRGEEENGHRKDSEAMWVCADRQRLMQILLNLVSNAVKYNKPQGTVFIDYLCDAENVQIRVLDDGPGLNAQQKKRLFTPFDRLGAEDTGVDGTGIGLALSRNLAAAMGGTLNFDYDWTQGCLFWVELPKATAPESQSDTVEESTNLTNPPIIPSENNAQNKSGQKRLVYVEDNPSNRRLVEIIVKQRPEFDLESVSNGTAGLTLLRSDTPDLLLLDAQLPDMDGEDILTLLRQDASWNQIPIVIVTADATSSRERRMLEAGANALLTKPIRVNQFWQTIESLLDNSGADTPENHS